MTNADPAEVRLPWVGNFNRRPMKITRDYPPNFEEIATAIPEARRKGTIFCYGDTIYNPDGGPLTEPLLAHERVHSERQGATDESIREWWRRYIASPQVRLDEELPAHQAEYDTFCKLHRDRGARHKALIGMAGRLSGPLYGGLLSLRAAVLAIRDQPRGG